MAVPWDCPFCESFSPAASGFLDSCDPLPGPQGREGVGRWNPRPVSQCSALCSLAPGGRTSAYEELEVSRKRVPAEGFRVKMAREQGPDLSLWLCLAEWYLLGALTPTLPDPPFYNTMVNGDPDIFSPNLVTVAASRLCLSI